MDKNPPRNPVVAALDIETTGLDECHHPILEVGVVLVRNDVAMAEIARRSWVLHFNGQVSPHIAKMHGPRSEGGNGLLAESRQSDLTHEQASRDIVAWLRDNGAMPAMVDASGCPILGSTGQPRFHQALLMGRNAQFDMRFIRNWMPVLEGVFSHRLIDVTTLRREFEWFAPGVALPTPQHRDSHRSLDDVDDDLATVRAIRSHIARGFYEAA